MKITQLDPGWVKKFATSDGLLINAVFVATSASEFNTKLGIIKPILCETYF